MVQVQRWLGHASPDFTLKTYVHLLEDGIGEADFLADLTGPDSATVEPPTPIRAAA